MGRVDARYRQITEAGQASDAPTQGGGATIRLVIHDLARDESQPV
jgi:hypothetical protein